MATALQGNPGIVFQVSIHATLAGGDQYDYAGDYPVTEFLSTPPSRVATVGSSFVVFVVYVSIHATLAGGDRRHPSTPCQKKAVSIHATLAGGDAKVWQTKRIHKLFLSTPPSRVATRSRKLTLMRSTVSIHATLAGGDRQRGRSL